MSYLKNVRKNKPLKDALWEVPAVFIFVILHFLIITHFISLNGTINQIGGTFLFSGIWFLLVLIFSLKTNVHILPVVSFTDSLVQDDFSIFLYRLPGQFTGALLATLLVLFNIETDYIKLYPIQLVPIDAFLTGIFTGFFAQFIYFLYFLLIIKNKSTNPKARLLYFSLGLGVLFYAINLIGNITLFNPFGILFSSLLSGHPVSLNTFLVGSIIHVIVPMVFITGTHYFLTGFILKKNHF